MGCITLAILGFVAVISLAKPSLQTEGKIWQPKPMATWQWQLSTKINSPGFIPVNTSVEADVYDIDLFFTTQEDIDLLHSLGRKVICYFSAGTWEPWRWDSMGFPNDTVGRSLDLWAGEKYLNVKNISLLAPTIESRLDLAVEKKCDAIEPDNVDAYLLDQEVTGFDITEDDQVAYLKYLSAEAHKRFLSIGLKNTLGLVDKLVDDFDWVLSESCNLYGDKDANCSNLIPFVEANKAVFGVEYFDNDLQPWELAYTPRFCDAMNQAGFSWIVKSMILSASPYYSCQTNILISDDPFFNGPLPQAPTLDDNTGPTPKMAWIAESSALANHHPQQYLLLVTLGAVWWLYLV